MFGIRLPDATHLDLIHNEVTKVCTGGEIERQRDKAIEIESRMNTSPSLSYQIDPFPFLFPVIL